MKTKWSTTKREHLQLSFFFPIEFPLFHFAFKVQLFAGGDKKSA